MNTSKTYLIERSTDTGVFQDMDKFDMSDSGKFELSIRLQFPKFSKGFAPTDFDSFIEENIGVDNLAALGRLAFPNEWQMRLTKPEIREKLIRLGRTKINTRSCWISPLSQMEIRGFVHWLPNAVSDEKISSVLEEYGEVLFIEVAKNQKWSHVDSDSRYFAVILKPGRTMDDLPHFFKIEDYHGLISVRGRNPICFHCRIVGHRKSECKKYREKLSDYSLRPPNGGKNRIKPRGKRYKPSLKEGDKQTIPSKNKKKKKSKATASQTTQVENKSVSTISGALHSGTTVAEVGGDLSKLDVMKNLEALQTLTDCLASLAITSKEQLAAVSSKLSISAVNVPQNISEDIEEPVPNEQNNANEKKSKSKKKKKKKNKAVAKSNTSDNAVAAAMNNTSDNVAVAAKIDTSDNVVIDAKSNVNDNAIAAAEIDASVDTEAVL